MMELELLSVLAEKAGKAYPTEELNRMWEMILTNQFHDILPGTCIHPLTFSLSRRRARSSPPHAGSQPIMLRAMAKA